MNAEGWNSLFQWGSVILILVTFVFGAGALITGNKINVRQTERILTLEKDVAIQQERAAKAEEALVGVQSAIHPRWLNDKEGDEKGQKERAAALAKFAGTLVAIQAVPDLEAEKLATQMAAGLRSAGWNVELLTPDKPRAPIGFIMSGVVVYTLEQAPIFPKPGDPPDIGIKMSPPSRTADAARALVAVWEPTLGPPFGPRFFGIHWEPAYPPNSEVGSMFLRYGFPFPRDGVLVLIGQQPIEYMIHSAPRREN